MDTTPHQPEDEQEPATTSPETAWQPTPGTDPAAAWQPAAPVTAPWAAPQAEPEPPTVPGLDPTLPYQPQPGSPGSAAPDPAAPRWQPLPDGTFAPPYTPPQAPQPGSWQQVPPSGQPVPPAGWQPPAPNQPWSGAAGSWPGQGGGWPPPGQPPAPPAGGYGYPGQTPGYGAGWTPAGSGGGYGGQPPYQAGAGDGPPAPSTSHTGRILLAVLAVVALVAGAGGLGALIGSSSPSSSNGGTTRVIASQPIPSVPKGSSGTGSSKINVSAIAAEIDPATVDITSILGTEDEEAEGTGIILTSNGEVLTNNHVIEGATSITAQVDGTGTRYTVKVVGVDPTDDVALVLLEGASGLHHVTIGNSSDVKVGDPVVAIGNALGLGGTPTVTSGIISALGRSIDATDETGSSSEHLYGLLQTDAPINPGNSGGPLVDAAGQVIGMDTAAASGSSSQSASNIGFAIPINRAIRIAQEIQQGKASSTVIIGSRAVIGVEVETVQEAEEYSGSIFGGGPVSLPVDYGAYVAEVVTDSPAERAGIAAGDVIIAVNGAKVSDPNALEKALEQHQPGDSISVTWVTGNGARETQSLTLVAGPAQ